LLLGIAASIQKERVPNSKIILVDLGSASGVEFIKASTGAENRAIAQHRDNGSRRNSDAMEVAARRD
jgi:hypothetical protein